MTVEEIKELAARLREAAAFADDPVLVCRLAAGAWAADRLAEGTTLASDDVRARDRHA
jgi:hypothetical protein